MNKEEDEQSSLAWFGRGMRGIFSLPAFILMLSFVGFCSLTAQAGIPVQQVVFMTGIVWALPAKVILVGSMMSGANLAAAFLAVSLSSVRLMPMAAVRSAILRHLAEQDEHIDTSRPAPRVDDEEVAREVYAKRAVHNGERAGAARRKGGAK